jgi:hypothetical protein
MLVRTLSLLTCSLLLTASTARAQEPPKPGTEHEKLKQLEGTWDCTIKMMGVESKGVMKYKMEVGGLWLVSDFVGEFGGMKFTGKGLDTYDAQKKKYVGVWVDAFSTSPLNMTGEYDAAGKVLTMEGEGPGPDGKPMKYRMVQSHKDADTIDWSMASPGPDGKWAIMLEMTYKRRK